jgi:aminopeptidase Y
MVFFSGFALCAAITSVTALQIPLLSSSNQAPLGHPHGTKPLVNSTELQDLISGDRLMARAKKMYEIAKLGEEEYNHPTRVIGSAGTFAQVTYCVLMLISLQVTSERFLTSMKLSSSLATTTQSPINPFQL